MPSTALYIECMPLYTDRERSFLSAVAQLGYANPFLPERVEYERAALGRRFVPSGVVWSASVTNPEAPSQNVIRIHAQLEPVIEKVRARLARGDAATADELRIYEDCVQHLLYQRFYERFVAAHYRQFLADWEHFFALPGRSFVLADQPAHAFACFRQIQRASLAVFDKIIGNSMPAARLRAAVWQSVFACDMRRYARTMYARMRDFPTLITGPSGTGKELVARAIAGSLYVPFDAQSMTFAETPKETFFPINIAALSPTLIESELFGHRRGAFTGAIADRKGWLEACPAAGAVFLDELGEMDLSIQVKLLRVIETRRFSAVGDTASREFSGKLVAATNRDLPREIRAGHFREDLYYRLCADLIRTPSLSEQIEDAPQVLDDLVYYMVRRQVGADVERTLGEVRAWMKENLPADYRWPGNYRELEQCVRNVIIRRSYQPLESSSGEEAFESRFRAGALKADEVLNHYCALVYRQSGSYEEAARRLGMDRRTVRAKVLQVR